MRKGLGERSEVKLGNLRWGNGQGRSLKRKFDRFQAKTVTLGFLDELSSSSRDKHKIPLETDDRKTCIRRKVT